MFNLVSSGLKGIIMDGLLSYLKGSGIMLVSCYGWELLPSCAVMSWILFDIWGRGGRGCLELTNTSYKCSCYINLFKYTGKTGVMPWNQIIHNMYTTQSSCNLKCKNFRILDGSMRLKCPSVWMNAVAANRFRLCCQPPWVEMVLQLWQIKPLYHYLETQWP